MRPCFYWQRPAGCEVIVPARGTGVLGRANAGNPIAVVR
jgi:hypothetical protein